MNPNRFLLPPTQKTWRSFFVVAFFFCCVLPAMAQQQSRPLPIANRVFTGYQSYFATPVNFIPTQKVVGATVTVAGVKSQFVAGAASSITLYWNDTLIVTQSLPNEDTVSVRLDIPQSYLHQSRNVLGLEISLTEGGNPCTTLYKKDLWFKGLSTASIQWKTAGQTTNDLLSALGNLEQIVVHPNAAANTKLLASAMASKIRLWGVENLSFRYAVDTANALFVGLAKNIPPSLAIGVYDVPPMETARLSKVQYRDSAQEQRTGLLLTAVNENGIEKALQQVLHLQPEEVAGKNKLLLSALELNADTISHEHLPLNAMKFCEATQTGWYEVRQFYQFSRKSLPGAYEAFLLQLQSVVVDHPANANLVCSVILNGNLLSTQLLESDKNLLLTDSISASVLKEQNELEVVYKLTGEMPPCIDVGRYLTLKTNTKKSGLYGLDEPVAALNWQLPVAEKNAGVLDISDALELAGCELATQVVHSQPTWKSLQVLHPDSNPDGPRVHIATPEDLDLLVPFSNQITWSARGIYIATGERDTTFIDLDRSDAAVVMDVGSEDIRTVYVVKDIISVNALRPYFNDMASSPYYTAYWNSNGESHWQPYVASQPVRWKLSWFWDRYKVIIVLGATLIAILTVVFNFIRARIKRKANTAKA